MIENQIRENKFADFGLDLKSIPSFSVSGTWDKEKNRHFNIHSGHQILTVRDGMLLLVDHFERQPLYRNMAAFIPAGVAHMVKVMRKNQSVTCHSVFVSKDKYHNNSKKICVFEMSDLSTAILKKLNEKNLVNLSKGIMGHCLDLFLELLDIDLYKPAHLITLPEARDERNNKIISFIRDNYMNKIRLEHFTRVVPLSVRQLTRNFRDELKISIMEYLRLYRLLLASILLHEEWRKIIDIAFDCGYDTISCFHESFKLHFGLSPNSFRKKILE